MKKIQLLAQGLALTLALGAAGVSAQTTEPILVVKTGVMLEGENLCFGASERFQSRAEKCSWFAAHPEAGLVFENGRLRPKFAQHRNGTIVGEGGFQFTSRDTIYANVRFADDYLGEAGWKAMYIDVPHFGGNCMAVAPKGTSYEMVINVGTDAVGIDPSRGRPVCAKQNIPENQIWLHTIDATN